MGFDATRSSRPTAFRPIACIAAIVLGLFLTAACGGNAAMFGITGSAPLGTLAAYEAALEDKVQSVSEFDEEWTMKLLGAYDGPEYSEGLSATKFDNTGEYVIAVHDESGTIKAVFSNFRSQAGGFSTTGKLIEVFASKLWLEVAGSEATFVATHYNERSDEQYYLAQFGGGRRGGEYRKEAYGGDLAAVRSITDTLWIWAD